MSMTAKTGSEVHISPALGGNVQDCVLSFRCEQFVNIHAETIGN